MKAIDSSPRNRIACLVLDIQVKGMSGFEELTGGCKRLDIVPRQLDQATKRAADREIVIDHGNHRRGVRHEVMAPNPTLAERLLAW